MRTITLGSEIIGAENERQERRDWRELLVNLTKWQKIPVRFRARHSGCCVGRLKARVRVRVRVRVRCVVTDIGQSEIGGVHRPVSELDQRRFQEAKEGAVVWNRIRRARARRAAPYLKHSGRELGRRIGCVTV